MPAKPLTPEQLEDARRLHEIFIAKKKDIKGLTQESLAHACGWKTQGSVHQYLKGMIPLNLPALRKFSEALNVNPREISPELAKGLDVVISNAEVSAQNVIASYTLEKSNIKTTRSISGEVPKISWVKAGDLCDVDDFLEPGDAKAWLICPVKHGRRTFALQVDGPSMDSGDREGYPDGYDIFVDPDIEPKHGDDVVVRTPDGQATFKRLQKSPDGMYLLALNPEWPNRIIKVPEGTVICGVVIYSGKPRR